MVAYSLTQGHIKLFQTIETLNGCRSNEHTHKRTFGIRVDAQTT